MFKASLKTNTQHGAATLAGMLSEGWEVILRHPGGSHFVYLEYVAGPDLHIIDPWDGLRKVKSASDYAGVRAALRTDGSGELTPPPPPLAYTLRGVHDESGAQWLLDNRLTGWCTIACYLGTDAQQLDLQRYADAGIHIVLRLTYSYATDDAGGGGTMPVPSRLQAHEDAVVRTMELNPQAWGFVYGNEPNNKREWPGHFELTPTYYRDSYNRIWARKPAGAKLSPCAIDPYNGGWGDWRVNWATVLSQITGCDFLALHAYTHGPNPALVWGIKQFSDVPLVGVFYDLRVLQSQMYIIPDRFKSRPIVVTETNHWVKWDGTVGWEADAGGWVAEAYKYFKQQGVAGATLFRHGYEQWRYGNLPNILNALKEVV